MATKKELYDSLLDKVDDLINRRGKRDEKFVKREGFAIIAYFPVSDKK